MNIKHVNNPNMIRLWGIERIIHFYLLIGWPASRNFDIRAAIKRLSFDIDLIGIYVINDE